MGRICHQSDNVFWTTNSIFQLVYAYFNYATWSLSVHLLHSRKYFVKFFKSQINLQIYHQIYTNLVSFENYSTNLFRNIYLRTVLNVQENYKENGVQRSLISNFLFVHILDYWCALVTFNDILWFTIPAYGLFLLVMLFIQSAMQDITVYFLRVFSGYS